MTRKKKEVSKLICHLLIKNVIIGANPFGHLILCHCVKTVGLSCVCQLFGFLYRNVNMGADVVLADKIVEVCPLKNGMDFRIDT